MKRILLTFAVLLSCVAALPAAEAGKKTFFFRKGDRVLFLGDSITEQYQYSSYIELYLTTRFPTWELTFLNAGIGGDTARGGANRFKTHVLAEKPTAITIDFGMNDGGYGDFNDGRSSEFLKCTEEMLKAAKDAGVNVALISPNAVEVRNNPGLAKYLETQKRFYGPLKELAAKYEDRFVDQYDVTRQILEKIATDKAAFKPFGDGVHTGPAGGLLMAHTILVGLKAPAQVSSVVIDAKAQTGKGTRATVKDVVGGPEGVSFERTDAALPLPVIKEWREILPYLNDLKDLNYYGLKVTKLAKGNYNLTIDGAAAGTYSAADLAAGINLGNLPAGPLFDQGEQVRRAIDAKNDLVHKRFREVVMGNMADDAKNAELKKRTEVIDAKQAEVYKLVQPKPHKFELKPAQ